MLRNIFSNWALVVVQIAVLLYQTPIQVHALGLPGQDVWLTIAALTGTLVLLTLGLPMASVRFIAVHAARKEVEQTNAAIATCLAVSLVLAAAALGVSGGLWIFFERTYLDGATWRALSPAVQHQAGIAFWLAAGQVSFNFVAQLPYGILDAHDDFPARNAVKTAGIVVRLALIVFVLRLHPSLILLAWIQIAAMIVELGACLLVIRRRWPHLRFGLRGADLARVRPILGFSLFAMLLNLGSQLSFQTDQLVINAFGTPEQGTFFDVGNKFFPPLTQLIIGIGMVMMPTAARLQARGQQAELRAAFLKWSKLATSLSLLVGVYLLVLGPEFLAFWMGPGFATPSGQVTRVIMTSFLLFLPARGVASPMLMGLGKPALVSLSFLAMGLVNLGLSLALVKPLGIFGVAVGTAIPCVLFAVGVAWLGCRAVGVSPREYAAYVLLRPTLGVALPAALLVFIKTVVHPFDRLAPRSVAIVPLAVSGLELVGLFVAVSVLYVYRGDPHVDLGRRVDRFVPGFLRGHTGRAAARVRAVTVTMGAFAAAMVPFALPHGSPTLGLALALALSAGVLAVVLAELVARAIVRGQSGYYRYTPFWREEHRFDRALLPQLPAVSRVEINADGERGDPPPRPGEPVYRALVVGGSAAECFYLDQDATWPAVVQRVLNEPDALASLAARSAREGRPPCARVHVGNISRSIVPVEQLHFMLRKVLPRYPRLDLLLVMVGGADVTRWVERSLPRTLPRGEVVLDKIFERHPRATFGLRPSRTALWRLLSQANRRLRRPVVVERDACGWLRDVRRMRAQAPGRVDEIPDPAPMLAHFEEHLRALLETARQAGARVVLARQPWFGKTPTPDEEAMFWNFGLGRPYKEKVSTYLTPRVVHALMRAMDARAASVAASMGVQHVDLMAALEPSAKTFYDELHFTPDGAEVVGRTVANAIVRGIDGETETRPRERDVAPQPIQPAG
jgi:O-antigen/teichoic acid export membrane protein